MKGDSPHSQQGHTPDSYLEGEVMRLRAALEDRDKKDMEELKANMQTLQQGQTLIAQQLLMMKSEFAKTAEMAAQSARITVLELDRAKTIGAMAILGSLTIISGTVSWFAHSPLPGK